MSAAISALTEQLDQLKARNAQLEAVAEQARDHYWSCCQCCAPTTALGEALDELGEL